MTGLLLLSVMLSGCMRQSTHSTLDTDYDQLSQRLFGEISRQQVQITRSQGAITIAMNSGLLFPSGGRQIPPEAAQTIAKMAPILASLQHTQVVVTDYTESGPIAPDFQRQGIESNLQLSFMRAQAVMQVLTSHGVNPTLVTAQGLEGAQMVVSNGTAEGRAENRVQLTLAGSGN